MMHAWLVEVGLQFSRHVRGGVGLFQRGGWSFFRNVDQNFPTPLPVINDHSLTSPLHILHGGCVTRASHIHCIYFIEHMWHMPTDPSCVQLHCIVLYCIVLYCIALSEVRASHIVYCIIGRGANGRGGGRICCGESG